MTDVLRLLESRRLRVGRWAGAAAVVCALHVGGAALALMSWHEQEAEDDTAGAVMVELAQPSPAARVDSPDLAHGPEQPEAKLAPEAAKEVVDEVEKDIPPVDPSPAPEPEVALPKPQPEEEKPKEEEAKEAVAEPDHPQQDHDAVATAPPRVDEQPMLSPPVRPQGRPSPSVARMQESWKRGLVAKLNRNKLYPDAASRRGIKGMTLVRFSVDRTGQVIASEVVQSSGSAILDEEALALLKRVSPVPPPPDEITDEMLDNLLPIWFGIKPNP